jgi:glycosyltransferase involved in cell wall biosynthesis
MSRGRVISGEGCAGQACGAAVNRLGAADERRCHHNSIRAPHPMKVLHLTLSLDGGAGIACHRLHDALSSLGVAGEIWTSMGKPSPAVKVVQGRLWRWRARVDRLPLKVYRRQKIFAWWSNNWLPGRLLRRAAADNPDVIHLHWVGDGWIDLAEIPALGVPVVWTLHDAWPFTGGCHYTGGCRHFMEGCGRCPQLGSAHSEDLSARNFARKERVRARSSIAFVAPSRWMAELAGRSRGMLGQRVEVIANGLDEHVFTPAGRKSARASFGLGPDDRALLVFASGDAADHRKGIGLVCEALEKLIPSHRQRLRLLVAGSGQLPVAVPGTINLGRINHEQGLVAAYSAADAHWLPALEDNLPNTAIESLACGCPVLANPIGGLPEIVDPMTNGWLAENVAAVAHANSIALLIEATSERLGKMRVAARDSFLAKFRASDRAADYLRVYRSLLKTSG